MLGWFRHESDRLTEHRRALADYLVDYPIYEPPHRQGPNHRRQADSPEYRRSVSEFAARGRENFAFFLDQRAARLVALRSFLAKFSVNAALDDAGLAAVSAWLPGNCGALASNLRSPATRQNFFQFATPWTGQWCGMNVIFDLGIFLGECLIARNGRLHWIYEPGASDDESANHTGYGLAGFRKRRDHLDPPGYIYGECGNDEVDLTVDRVGRYVRPDYLVGKVRDFSMR